MRLHRHTLLFCIALSACSNPGPDQDIAPEVVLQRATRAVQTLESAQYVIQADFDMKTETLSALGTARMDGMLADAGNQLRFQLDLTADVSTTQGDSSLTGVLEVVVISEDEVYMNVHSLTSQPSSAFFLPEMVSALAGQWWLLSQDDTPPMAESVTPDPRLLQAQAQVVSVTRDRGITQLNGIDVHHFDVSIDPQKLSEYLSAIALEKGEEFDTLKMMETIDEIQASGQLWIDAETYYVQKINWVVQSMPLESGGTASVSFTITFRNHNNSPTIIPPQDAKLFTPAVFYTLPSQALFPEEINAQLPSDFSDEALFEIYQKMNSY